MLLIGRASSSGAEDHRCRRRARHERQRRYEAMPYNIA